MRGRQVFQSSVASRALKNRVSPPRQAVIPRRARGAARRTRKGRVLRATVSEAPAREPAVLERARSSRGGDLTRREPDDGCDARDARGPPGGHVAGRAPPRPARGRGAPHAQHTPGALSRRCGRGTPQPQPRPRPGRAARGRATNDLLKTTFFVTERTHDIELFPGCQLMTAALFRELIDPFAWRSVAFFTFSARA